MSVCICLFNTWWGWWGPWYLECNYSKQFDKLLSYDRHRFRHCSCLSHQQAHKAHLRDCDFEVGKSVHGRTSQDESLWKQSVQVYWNTTSGCKTAGEIAIAWKLSFTAQGLAGVQVMQVRAAYIMYVGPHTTAGSIQGKHMHRTGYRCFLQTSAQLCSAITIHKHLLLPQKPKYIILTK